MQTKFFLGGEGVYWNYPVCPDICNHNSLLTDEQILMKLNTVAVYDLRMCMKENKSDPKYKGDSW